MGEFEIKKKILERIFPEEALEILCWLANSDADLARKIDNEAERILMNIDPGVTGEEVFYLGWARGGGIMGSFRSSRHGYSSPEEMAVEMLEEELDAYNKEVAKYFELRRAKEATLSCVRGLKSIYKYDHESKLEFKN